MAAVSTAVARTLSSIARAPISIILASIVMVGLSAGLLLWRWSQLPFLIFGLAPAVGGYFSFCANIARDRPIRTAALMSGFTGIDRWTGVVVMLYLHMIAASLPLVFAIGIGNMGGRDVRWLWWTCGIVISTPLVLLTLRRVLFVAVAATQAPRDANVAAIFESAGIIAAQRPRATTVALATAIALIGLAAITNGVVLLAGVPALTLFLIHLHDALQAEVDGTTAADMHPAAGRGTLSSCSSSASSVVEISPPKT